MKRLTIHSLQTKLFSIIVLLLATVQTALSQSGYWTDATNRATSYASGSGTQADPYIIKTAAQLAYFSSRITGADKYAYVELGAHIDLSGHWWRPMGNDGNSRNVGFQGHFDGKGYFISNMSCDWSSQQNAGLFSFLNAGASVKNLVIDGAFLSNQRGSINSGGQRVGVLFAGTDGTGIVVENIIIRNSKISVAKPCSMGNTWVEIGGLGGTLHKTPTFRNCYVDVDIDLTNITNHSPQALKQAWYGKFLGSIEDKQRATMQNIYVAGSLRLASDIQSNFVGTFIGDNETSNGDALFADNCYYNSLPTIGETSTPLTLALKQGEQKAFGSYFLDLTNSYVETATGLDHWRLIRGVPYLSKNKVKLSESYTQGEKKTKVVLDGFDNSAGTATWKVDGKVATPDAGSDDCELTLPLFNKERTVETEVVMGGITDKVSLTLTPKTYSTDLYADKYAGGTGTKNDPYLISNDLELAKLARDVNTSSKNLEYNGTYFKLTDDIDLRYAVWMPIGTWNNSTEHYFGGRLMGEGHTIKNMQINWRDYSAQWSSWGLFSRLQGTNATEGSFACVSDLIVDSARVEKETGYKPVGKGLIIGIVVGEQYQYSELSNVIVKNSIITDNEETYSSSNSEYYIGGVTGNINRYNANSAYIYRVFNISTDTKVDMLKNANVNRKTVYIAGAIGKCDIAISSNPYQIFPTNIYVHGNAVETNATAGYTRGNVVGYIPVANSSTWYYANGLTGSNVVNYGTQKSLSEFASTFIQQNNLYLQNNISTDRYLWVYTQADGFNFGSTTLELQRGDADTLTATTPGLDGSELYYWYVSPDRKTWRQITNNDGSQLLAHKITLPYQDYNQYVFAMLQDGSSISNTLLVTKLTVEAKLNSDNSTGIYTVNVTNNFWDNNDNFDITYQWEKNGVIVGDNTASYNPGVVYDNDKIRCHVIVKDKSGKEHLNRWIYKAIVVYLCPADITIDGKTYAAGTDDLDNASWGYTPEEAMKTWRGAYSKLDKNASWTENIIVLMGTSEPSLTNSQTDGFSLTQNYQGVNGYNLNISDWQNTFSSPLRRKATITGKWENTDYEGTIKVGGDCHSIALWADTRFENITFQHYADQYDLFFCQYNSLEMGEGVVMKGYGNGPGYGSIDGAVTTSFQIFGGFNNDGRFYNDLKNGDFESYTDSLAYAKKGFNITLKSGHYSVICAGGRHSNDGTQNGVFGTPETPIKCTITMDINSTFNDNKNNNTQGADYDAGVILAGDHEGCMYGDVDIIIRSGKIARVVNGSLGNQRSFYGGYVPPYNTYMGRANILIDPASSEYAVKGESQESINDRVIITELYGGSLGRGFKQNTEIDNPFYGVSTVTINGGTFKVLPETNDKKEYIFSGIYGAGAGGMTGIGDANNHTADKKIPYWSGNTIMYGDYETAKNNLVHYNCYNADTQTYTEIDPTKTSTNVVITGGVFGSKDNHIDGVYAGGSGYMDPGLWTESNAIPNKDGGNLYGKNNETVASLTISGGEFYCTNGIFAGGRGTDKYFNSNTVRTQYGNRYIGGTRSDYKELGKTYGNVELNINGGVFHCPVFGGGYGVADAIEYGQSKIETLDNMARVYGKSTVRINGGTFYKNIYGGGDMAVVEYHGNDNTTNVIVSDSANIRSSIFAGGNGREYRPETATSTSWGTIHPELVGKVIGNTNISILGDTRVAPYIYGNIFGGGNLAQVQGNTFVNLYAGNFAGEIFGGGNGNLSTSTKNTSADVTGDTNVSLTQDQSVQQVGSNNEREDNFSINVIWNKLWDNTEEKFYEWDTKTGSNRNLFYDDGKFLNPHNIYGGGNLACNVAGTAKVTVLKGMTPYSLLNTEEWKDSYNDNDNPHFYVFGGGYGKNTTVGNTDVTVDVEGDYGIYDAEVDDDNEQLAKPGFVSSLNDDATLQEASSQDGISTPSKKVKSTTIPVFDNSKGIPNFTILGVMGGGYAGLVEGDTRVNVAGNTFLHRVYGGGFGDPKSTADNTTGQVGGNTEVNLQGAHVYGDVFGGGAGVAPKTANGVHFVSVARVLGTTKVNVSDLALIYGNVYGGGDMANVGEEITTKPTNYYDQSKLTSESTLDQTDGSFVEYNADGYKSFVNIVGGDIFGSVYGGGKGLTKQEAAQYQNVGRINGNTLVHVANSNSSTSVATFSLNPDDDFSTTAADSKGNIIPHIWHRVYGGCAYGTVDGNTLVHIEGGMLGINVFGGGYGNVYIEDDKTSEDIGASTDISTLNQVLGKKDTEDYATYANILGNTKVVIDGGSWIWNRMADINGNITTWEATEAKNNKICNSLDEFKQIIGDIRASKTLDDIKLPLAKAAIQRIKTDKSTQYFFDLDKHMFKKNHNIFGGGNRACYVGSYENGKAKPGTGEATVILNHSPLTEIEDGDGNTISMLDCTTLQGLCWYIGSRDVSHPQFSVFGAGYGANTMVGNTNVYARPGSVVASDGASTIEIGGKKYRYMSQSDDMKKYSEIERGYRDDFLKVSKEDKMRYFGSSTGGNADGTDDDPQTYRRYHATCIAWSLGVPGFIFLEVHGGGFSGYVAGDTYVETDCQLNGNNIFGAGLGWVPYGTVDESKIGDYDFGSVGGNSKVFIKSANISMNVYGGGSGVESVRLSGKNITDFSDSSAKIVDFTNMARVNGKTEVHVYGENYTVDKYVFGRTLIFGDIYGGGDVANVGTVKASAQQITTDAYDTGNSYTSLVDIRGGILYSHVFAGGKGRTKSMCADYTKLGGIYGNAFVVVDRPVMNYPYCTLTTGTSYNPSSADYMKHPAEGINNDSKPYLWERIYGGCQNGTVYGNTLVNLYDGHYGNNIFGGGWGSCDTLTVNGQEQIDITSANVTGHTNVFIDGGEMELRSYWLADTRFWEPTDIINGVTYSPQYDHETLKFKINHNIYAGGNAACEVGERDDNDKHVDGTGNTYITITKGLLYDNTEVVPGQSVRLRFFDTNEWREVFNKPGSPHFSVFGAGYGDNTNVLGDTHINIAMDKHGSIVDRDIKDGEEWKHFYSGYSVMDVIGGGYSGKVDGNTYIGGNGGLYCRRVFGGGFYNSVNATNVDIKAIDCQHIFGGGMMGDVMMATNVNIGTETTNATTVLTNKDIYVHGDIYGGNDVSGYVNVALDKNGYFADNGGTGTHINIYGGRIDGNVYGAGNGDYLYAIDKKGNTKVTVNEYYPLNPNDPNSETEPLVYTVPMRENMPSYKAASDATKIVNINSWRPMTNKVSISIKGESAEEGKQTVIKGDVFGGGNSASVQKVQMNGVRANVMVGSIDVNIGSHVNIGRVFMGCNGDALFTASEDNDFMNKFQKLNGDIDDYSKELNLADTIDWMNDPSNKGISTLYLPTKNEERHIVYPHLLDLYFQPVESDIQGTLHWNGTEEGTGLTDCTIGTFCCGGNRGNMNVYPLTINDYSASTPKASQKIGNVFEYTFPAGLTITDKIVGGCNNANYDYKGKVRHTGGYLLGEIHSEYPFIKLNIKNKFQPKESEGAYMGGNVYGGCYKSGTIRGDVSIVLESDMLEGKSKEMLEKSNELLASNAEYSALNVYGGGYGMESYVYGNTYVKMGKGIPCKAPSTTLISETSTDGASSSSYHQFNASGTSANFIYGGGQQGNVIGKTDVKVLNGHVFKSVTGGSYSGYVWGSTQIRVGYPEYYTVKPGFGGQFRLKRTDQNNKNIDEGKNVASETIKQTIRLIADDVVSQAVVDAIDGKYDFEQNAYVDIQPGDATYFNKVAAATPSVKWDNVNIVIGEAVYGGGYSLAQGGSVMANNTTVLKYDKDYNLDSGFDTYAENEVMAKNLGGTTAGFGGNTTVIIGECTKATDGAIDRDHITISRQDMKVANVADGQDLLGYYYKDDTEGTYHYIYQAGTYYKGGDKDKGTLPANMEGNDVYEYDNEGGVFGDGHLSYAEGFRSADLTGYGFASSTISSPKILNTFQRMDVLRLTDNCFSLLGARDYATNAMDKTPYSISRIDEIQMWANDVVTPNDTLQNSHTIRARNYMGFANNIHYVGALYSNVSFSDKWYNGKGKIDTNGSADTYQAVKQKYIDDYFATENGDGAIFEKRNDGTAKNMIGIASGYALKVQNAQEVVDDKGAISENLYYGPIYGVIEMNLIDVREDEGGGYVYADNIHKRTDTDNSSDETTTHSVDFLETTGNFVFPWTQEKGRYIVDDCFPIGYNMLSADEKSDPDKHIDAHYWYVTGFNYHYTAQITGYTFDSSFNNPIKFDSNNLDGIVALSGLKPSQKVYIESWKLYSEHQNGYECDLEQRNYSDDAVDIEGDHLKQWNEEKNDYEYGYVLHVGAANEPKYVQPGENGVGFAAELSLKENASQADCKVLSDAIPSVLPNGNARIVFQLEDKVNNTTSDYFNSRLSQPCKATLVLAAQALDDKGNIVKGYMPLSKVYTRKLINGKYEYEKINTGKLTSGEEYYYKSGDANYYQKIDNFYKKDADTEDYLEVDLTNVDLSSGVIYYCYLDRFYTYTIDLTIAYVQGPDIEGEITIENCALPGERIRLRKNNVVVKADQAFSVNGYYWRIGKRKKVGDEWVFEDESQWSKYDLDGKGYDTYSQSDKEGKGLFAGCYYDKTDDYLDIPAYYFMDGYGIQLGVTMNVPGLDDILPVKMYDADKLTVHNYHRMNPHKEGLNLHLAEAISRAKTERGFAEPRIYLADQSDLTSFVQFVDTIGTASDAPRYGANAQFVLQSDLTMSAVDNKDYYASNFAGILHGNGYVINGLQPGTSLFNTLSDGGNIYNLGLSSGKISNMQAADGKLAQYHCCFEYAPTEASSDEESKPVVYRMDGTLDTHYTFDDFRLGKVAYDLNDYYLRARYSNTTKDDTLALKYVFDYFANGDYQYSHRTDEITGKNTGVKYLRTGKDSDLPNYEQAETRHDKTHAIDKARAQGYVAATADIPESRIGNYLPLFNDNKNGEDAMNDFLFWGQSLQSTPADYPTEIASHQVAYMTNRVYRTAAYYGDTNINTYHYNAYNLGSSFMNTYVHNAATTAIDFTCQNDFAKAWGISDKGIYCTPISDNADSFHDFIVKDGVTQNLLVYTAANSTDNAKSNEVYDVVDKALNYDETTRESLVKGHHIAANETGFSTPRLHLVERTSDGKNSEGETCANNNFCAPIPFTVSNHAWYTRRPMQYANDNTGSWEGICLPFTVHKAVASMNGEITHFYGNPTQGEKDNPDTNIHTLHHEYWLRGLMSVADDAGKQSAMFQRPGYVGSKLFAPVDAEGNALSEVATYTFANKFFINTYENRLYNKDANQYYDNVHFYDGYQLLSAGVPYIVRFPGERYYEFDLSSNFYNDLMGRNAASQTITFNAYGQDNEAEQSLGTVSIPVTSAMSTSANYGYSHCGTFAATEVAKGSIYGINTTGTAFDDASAISTVMPFRTYMYHASAAAKQYAHSGSAIYIAETTDIDKIVPNANPDEEDATGNYLIIRPIGGNKVRIESSYATTMNVVTTTGQLYRIIDVQPGISVYSGFQQGVYLFGNKKMMIRK